MHPWTRVTTSGFALSRLLSERWKHLLVLVAALGIVVAVWVLRGYIAGVDWKVLGYPGVFLVSFIGAVSMVLPLPGLISQCGVSVFLHPAVVGLMAGIGEALGESSAYAVGYGGSEIVQRRRFYPIVEGWMQRRGTLVLFLVSLIPNPLMDIVGIAAGATRFPFSRFMATVLVGKALKGLMVSYTCYFGVKLLPWVT